MPGKSQTTNESASRTSHGFRKRGFRKASSDIIYRERRTNRGIYLKTSRFGRAEVRRISWLVICSHSEVLAYRCPMHIRKSKEGEIWVHGQDLEVSMSHLPSEPLHREFDPANSLPCKESTPFTRSISISLSIRSLFKPTLYLPLPLRARDFLNLAP